MLSPGSRPPDLPNSCPTPPALPGPAPGQLVPAPAAPVVVHAARAHHHPAVLAPALNAVGLLQALGRRWLLAAFLGLVAAAAGGAAGYFLLPASLATAQTQLHVASVRPIILAQTPDGQADFANYQKTQAALVKSRLVLNSALREPEVAELATVRERLDPVEWLEKEIQVDFSLAPEVMRIALSGDRPEEQKAIVNAVRNAYLKEVVTREHTQRLKRLEQLHKLYEEYDDALRAKRRELRQKSSENPGSQDPKTLAIKQQLDLEDLHTAHKRLEELRWRIRNLQIEIDAQQARGDADDVAALDAAVERVLDSDPLVLVHQNRIHELETTIRKTLPLTTRGENDPEVKKLRARQEEEKELLSARRDEIRPKVKEQLQLKAQSEARGSLAQKKAELALLKDLEKLQKAEYERLEKEMPQNAQRTIDVEWLRDETTQVEAVAAKVGDKMKALEVELNAPPRVSLLEEAYVTKAPDDKRRLKTAGLGAAGALALALFGVSFWEFRARRVNSVDEVVGGLGLSLVGALPLLPKRARRGLIEADRPCDVYWHNLMTESIDATRTMLLHAADQEALRLVMVTSALQGEGKTWVSCHLAASLARAGCNTLLLDGDLRHPSVHALFGLDLGPGLSELLRGEVELAEAVHAAPVGGLAVIPAGRCDAATLQALTRKGLGAFFARLKKQYDFVVVDSAPSLLVTDSLLLGKHADAVVFAVLRGVSRLPAVYAACERLGRLGVRILGAVVNGARRDLYGAAYHYDYTPGAGR